MTPPPVLYALRWDEPPDLAEWVDDHPDLMQIESGEGYAFTYAFIYDGETVTVSEVTVGKCYRCGAWTWVETDETACCGATWQDVDLIDSYVAARELADIGGGRADPETLKAVARDQFDDDLVDALDDTEQHRALADHYERHFRSEVLDQETVR